MDTLTKTRNGSRGELATNDNFTLAFCISLGIKVNQEDHEKLKKTISSTGTVNFFMKRISSFPDDIDSTAMTYLSLRKKPDKQVILKIASMYNPSKGFEVYFGNKKLNRYDSVVDLNVIRLLKYFGLEQELTILAINKALFLLRSGDFKKGGRYYFSPFSFLFFLFKLHLDFGDILSNNDLLLYKDYLNRNKSKFFLDKCMHNWLVHHMDFSISMYEIYEIENDALYKSGSKELYWNSKQILQTFKKINDELFI